MSGTVAIQLSLTSAESKKLISKSIFYIEFFKKALRNGLIIIHPSSTTYFIYEELTGKRPYNWVCGVIAPKGACINKNFLNALAKDEAASNLEKFNQYWFFKNGNLIPDPLR